MIKILIVIFAIALLLTFLTFKKKLEKVILVFFAIILIIVTSTRGPGVDRDYENYKKIFIEYKTYEVESTFYYISHFITNFLGGEVFYLFFIYALLGIGIKFFAINRLTKLKTLSVLVYVSYYFILHDFTQVRAGVASALLLCLLQPIYDRKWFKFFIIATIAIFFHYSALILLPLWFLNAKTLNKWYYLLIPAAYVCYALNVNIVTVIPIEEIRTKIELYQKLQEYDVSGEWDVINVFNLFFIARILIFYYLFFFYEKLQKINNLTILLIKIYGISLALFVVLSTMPILAFRVNELMGIVEIILIPLLIYTMPNRTIGKLVVYVIASAFIFLLLFYNRLIT